MQEVLEHVPSLLVSFNVMLELTVSLAQWLLCKLAGLAGWPNQCAVVMHTHRLLVCVPWPAAPSGAVPIDLVTPSPRCAPCNASSPSVHYLIGSLLAGQLIVFLRISATWSLFCMSQQRPLQGYLFCNMSNHGWCSRRHILGTRPSKLRHRPRQRGSQTRI